ncbi:MAG: hypothetical protein AAGH38_10285 [Pseudomonadota bacterium]
MGNRQSRRCRWRKDVLIIVDEFADLAFRLVVVLGIVVLGVMVVPDTDEDGQHESEAANQDWPV